MLLLISNQICFAENEAYKAYLAKYALEHPTSVSNTDVNTTDVNVSTEAKVSHKVGATQIVGGGVAGAATSLVIMGAALIYNKIVDNTEKDK